MQLWKSLIIRYFQNFMYICSFSGQTNYTQIFIPLQKVHNRYYTIMILNTASCTMQTKVPCTINLNTYLLLLLLFFCYRACQIEAYEFLLGCLIHITQGPQSGSATYAVVWSDQCHFKIGFTIPIIKPCATSISISNP